MEIESRKNNLQKQEQEDILMRIAEFSSNRLR